MRTINQIIEDARAQLNKQRADEAEAAATVDRERRAANRELWRPIIEALKPMVPAELHNYIFGPDESEPHYRHVGEHAIYEACRPVHIVLPTPERYTVFGYYFDANHWGFEAGALKYDDEGEAYFTPAGYGYGRGCDSLKSQPFEIALAETVENYYSPRELQPTATDLTPTPFTTAERLESLIREIAREAVTAEIGEPL
jgi:hypothetical protein